MTWHIVTGNAGKRREYKQLFDGLGVPVEFHDVELQEPQSNDLRLVSMAKLQDALAKLPSIPASDGVLVEDACLEVSALRGFPGPYTKYVLQTIGLEGVLQLMQRAEFEHRNARFLAVITARMPDGTLRQFEGTLQGTIGTRVEGGHGFGFDPIFVPSGSRHSLATFEPEAKNQISHRSRALAGLLDAIRT